MEIKPIHDSNCLENIESYIQQLKALTECESYIINNTDTLLPVLPHIDAAIKAVSSEIKKEAVKYIGLPKDIENLIINN